ncbi:zinc-ribbon domain-containing protein [Stappia sp.]|uniref:zinc-ribbon domain-containing protein n=1 Tax=Stappia sp. TaxID=1870903 RepID=UPI003C7BDB09
MALIACSECSKAISDKAASCPHCGAPVEPRIQLKGFKKVFSEENLDRLAKNADDRAARGGAGCFRFVVLIVLIVLVAALFL